MGTSRPSTPASPGSRTGLERERVTFESRRAGLLKDEGQFVLIRGDEVAGVWPSYEEALEAGYGRYGPVPFLVKQILSSDPVYTVTRDVLPCPT